MKKILISVLLATSVLAVSCNQSLLDIPQKGVIPVDEFYKTDQDAEDATLALYATAARGLINPPGAGTGIYIPYIVATNGPSDDMYAGGSDRNDNVWSAEVTEFRFQNDNQVITRFYRGLYLIIYAANLVTDKFEYGRSASIDRNISEARVWRAWAHMILAIYWNNPPKVDKVLVNEQLPNTPHDELLEWVIAELGDAASYLPARNGTGDKNGAVRLTKGAAYAFMGKAQVFAGRYADAAATLKNNVIATGNYALVPGEQMHDIFHKAGNGNPEKIFEFNIVENPGLNFFDHQVNLTSWMHNNFWHWRTDYLNGTPSPVWNGGWGGCNPRGDFAEALIANDGIDSHRRQAWIKTYDEVLYDMPYLQDVAEDGTVMTQAQKERDPLRGVSSSMTGLFGHEGYFMWKRTPLRSDKFTSNDLFGNNLIVMRYAEVLMLYAEACAQSNTDTAGGLDALNQIQRRAGSNYISSTLTLEEVKKEKRFEMWMEGCRFADLVRWGEAATLLADSGKQIPTFRDRFGVDSDVHEGYVVWTDFTRDGPGFKAGKNEYFPYPFDATEINMELVQNPGW